MFCRSERNIFSTEPTIFGSENLVHFKTSSPPGSHEPVLRFRYDNSSVLCSGDENLHQELARYHLHRFAQLVLEVDPRGLRRKINFKVIRVMQGSDTTTSIPASSISEKAAGEHLSEYESNHSIAPQLYNTFRDYGFAHDFHGRNIFKHSKTDFTTIELLSVLSPEALRTLSLPGISKDIVISGARACAWASVLGVFSPFPLPPHQHTRIEKPYFPGSCFSISVIDLTFFWRQAFERFSAQKLNQMATLDRKSDLFRELVRATKVFGPKFRVRKPLDLKHGTNIEDYGINHDVFSAFHSIRERIQEALTKKTSVTRRD